MAKYIWYPDKFTDARGFSVPIANPDPKVQNAAVVEHNAAMKEEREAAKAAGEPMPPRRSFQPPVIEEASLSDLVCGFADNIPYGPEPKEGEPRLRSTPGARAYARKVIGAFIDRPDTADYLVFDEDALKWAINELKENGDLVWGGTLSQRVIEYLEDEVDHATIAKIQEREREAAGLPPVLAGPGAAELRTRTTEADEAGAAEGSVDAVHESRP